MVTTISSHLAFLQSSVNPNRNYNTSPYTYTTMDDNDSHSNSAADKKRNKLGYHRTAIACGHCRRRKIRCIPPADATSNRCQNCVRLKKDCQYYPVDQTTPATTKTRRGEAKSDSLNTESEASVSSSSPGVSMGAMDQYDPYRAHGGPYPTLSDPKTMMPPSENDYGYPQQFAGGSWTHQGPQARYFANSRGADDPQSHEYWPSNEQISQAPYGAPLYAMSANESSTGLTAADHPYSSFSSAAQEYPYSPHQARSDQIGNGNSMNSFGLYRPGGIAEPTDVQPAMSLQSQAIANPPYSTTSPPTQYPAGTVLAPRWTEPMQMQTTYSNQGSPQTWFNSGSGNGQDKNHVRTSHGENRHPYRGNPS